MIFSVVGVFAPVVMFSGETQVKTVIDGAAGYGIALLLVMAVGKLALLSVGFKSGFLGGPTFPLIFASVSVALALNIVFPGVPVAILVAGIMTGAVYVLFRTPLMVVLLTGFMLDEGTTMVALIVLAIATVMIVTPPLQKTHGRAAGREEGPGGLAGVLGSREILPGRGEKRTDAGAAQSARLARPAAEPGGVELAPLPRHGRRRRLLRLRIRPGVGGVPAVVGGDERRRRQAVEHDAQGDGDDDRGQHDLAVGDAPLEREQREHDRGEPARAEPADERHRRPPDAAAGQARWPPGPSAPPSG